MLATIDRQCRTRDEPRILRAKESNAARNFSGLAQAAYRYFGDDFLKHRRGHSSHHVRIDIARRDSVHGHAKSGALLRQGLGESMNARLGGRVRSEEHTSELQSLMRISYAVFCLKPKNTKITQK